MHQRLICKLFAIGRPRVSKRMSSTSTTAAILVIGDEILKGQTIDTNSGYMAKQMFTRGIHLSTIRTVGDRQSDICAQVRELSATHDHLFTCGGIGPTHDDITYEAVAVAFDDRCHVDDTMAAIVTSYFHARIRDSHQADAFMRLATIPTTSRLLWGNTTCRTKYPIVCVRNVVMLPGVPSLCRRAFDISILSLMGESTRRRVQHVLYSKHDEFRIAHLLTDVARRHEGVVNIGSYPDLHHSYYKVKLTVDSADETLAIETFNELELALEGNLIDFDDKPEVESATKFDKYVNRTKKEDYRVKLLEAVRIINGVLDDHDPSKLCMSFNGGKDCTALLYLLHMCMAKHAKHKGQRLTLAYFPSDDTFEEMDAFIKKITSQFNCELLTYPGRTKVALEKLCFDHPQLQVIFMGGRQTDPGHESMLAIQRTDPGWPPLLRVNALLHLDYAHIWKLLRGLCVPYCELYDRGYTSIGCKATTSPNELLAFEDAFNIKRYHPAYQLTKTESERHGRYVNKLSMQ